MTAMVSSLLLLLPPLWLWQLLFVLFGLGYVLYWALACTGLCHLVLYLPLWRRRVLLVVAHPDDECMFFAPTIVALTRQYHCQLYVLCMSRGALTIADSSTASDSFYAVPSAGETAESSVRWTELVASCERLGVPAARVLMTSHTLLPDCMQSHWSPKLVARLVARHALALHIDTLVTFDAYGVSGHANHCDVARGVMLMVSKRIQPIAYRCYHLTTVNIVRKYCSYLDVLVSVLVDIFLARLCGWRRRALLVTPPGNWAGAAMRCHATQLVWYRRLYLLFSRYTLINTLQPLEPIDIRC